VCSSQHEGQVRAGGRGRQPARGTNELLPFARRPGLLLIVAGRGRAGTERENSLSGSQWLHFSWPNASMRFETSISASLPDDKEFSMMA